MIWRGWISLDVQLKLQPFDQNLFSWKIDKSTTIEVSKKIICIPGNAGTSEIAQNISLDISNFNEILNTIKFFKINLVIVGPEEPLVNGLVNFLKKVGYIISKTGYRCN